MLEEKRICVAGLGGVGGYLGAVLAKRYPHVFFYVRGKRLESILQNGLHLISPVQGDITSFPEKAGDQAHELGEMDYIFVCVKNYSLESVMKEIRPMVKENTLIIPLLNGIDVSERIRKSLGRGIVLDSLVYITSGTDESFVAHHTSPYCRIHVGVTGEETSAKTLLPQVSELLEGAGISCILEKDIEAAIWKKYILNCAYNIVTAYYSVTTDELRRNPSAVEALKQLLEESCQIARSLGVRISPSLETEHLSHVLERQAGSSTSSLRRDMDDGRRNELDVFSGKLLELAGNQNISIPVTRRFYDELIKRNPDPFSQTE